MSQFKKYCEKKIFTFLSMMDPASFALLIGTLFLPRRILRWSSLSEPK